MRWFVIPRIGRLACALSTALLLLPEQASAQRVSRREDQSLSAAIEEAKRSPFHAHNRVSRSAHDRFAPGTDPGALVSWSGSAHSTAQEVGMDPQETSERGRNNRLFWRTALGIAAGDIIAYALLKDSGVAPAVFFLPSIPLATLGVSLAGTDPAWALVASSLGLATGLAAGHLTLWALEEPLYIAALVPAALVFYGVRVGVTMATALRQP